MNKVYLLQQLLEVDILRLVEQNIGKVLYEQQSFILRIQQRFISRGAQQEALESLQMGAHIRIAAGLITQSIDHLTVDGIDPFLHLVAKLLGQDAQRRRLASACGSGEQAHLGGELLANRFTVTQPIAEFSNLLG